MWLDERAFNTIDKFFTENIIIFKYLKNPWISQNLNDIAPSLDILSSATQVPDLGAKILLIYCCLEHLFVPSDMKFDNKKYVVGGIHALDRDLLHWFYRFYDLRCEYAHKGFIIKDDQLLKLVSESMKNVLALLIKKLNINQEL